MSRDKNILPEIVTGAFVAAVIALLAFFTIVISGVDLLRGSHHAVRRARFDHVDALKPQDPVLVRGMKVGAVQHLALSDNAVVVTFTVDADVPLQADASVTVIPTSLLGGSALDVVQGVSPTPLAPDAVLPGAPHIDVMRELGALVTELREAVDPGDLRELLANLRQSSGDLTVITGRLAKGEGLLGKLLDPQDTTYADLRAIAANLRQTTDRLNQGQGLLGRLLQEDDSTYADLKATVANLRAATAALNDPKTPLGRLLSADSPLVTDLERATAALNDPKTPLGRLLAPGSTLIADLETTAANLKTITAKLQTDQGTLGRLINDPALANEAEGAVKDVRQIIDNMRDTAPITTFTSLFFSGL